MQMTLLSWASGLLSMKKISEIAVVFQPRLETKDQFSQKYSIRFEARFLMEKHSEFGGHSFLGLNGKTSWLQGELGVGSIRDANLDLLSKWKCMEVQNKSKGFLRGNYIFWVFTINPEKRSCNFLARNHFRAEIVLYI
ncbi:hypothetical protein QVD17_29585 [Tagetes erecta]|uniref:Uncharacterized protein n=1 Tax=Tagetes erecta TaxID=13708 RepID=A0AAD8K196_TARER|nr:hypothetical protein QVD17_29585 [Tagetes erecta]